jgi:subtilisin family serine protease
MRVRPCLSATAILTLWLAACGDPLSISSSEPRLPEGTPRFGVAPAGTGFTFLPPTVARPAELSGEFDATRQLTVRVPCIGAAGIGCPLVAAFTMRPGADGIRVDHEERSYQVLWQVPTALTKGGGTYRVDVLEGLTVIGSAELWVAATTQEARRQRDPYRVVATLGKPLLIKFRVTRTTSVADELAGDPSGYAVEAIPDRSSEARAEDFATGHPTMGHLPLSFNTVIVRIDPAATVGAVNTMLAAVEARIIGGVRGVASQAAGVLVLRLPTTSHTQMNAALAVLRGFPVVRGAAPDMLQRDDALPALPPVDKGLGVPAPWTWELPGPRSGEGNWGFEISRVPQMWNLNGVVSRDGVRTSTGVWEARGFAAHPDLVYDERLLAGTDALGEHAVLVAGVIGATHGNGGIDGISPFARLVVGARSDTMGAVSMTVTDLPTWVRSFVRVLNTSWGQDYLERKSPMEAPDAAALADEHGRAVRDVLIALETGGARLPFIVASAGNYYSPARYGGPLKNAAMAHGVAAIITVESLAERFGGGVKRAVDSSISGTISAPGAEIITTDWRGEYSWVSGTSFAAPFVAGVVSYLYSLYPALPSPTVASNPVRDLLLANAIPAEFGTAARIDAFASALDADRLMGSDRALRGLLDISDNTLDGNTRVALRTGAVVTDTIVGGDGRVDMRDFRRWRDWLLQAEDVAGLNLDGPADHPKRDLNGDGKVQSPAVERVYARGDFNGDGVISVNDRHAMPGSFGGALTDLEVFQRLFSDSRYSASELPGLLVSGDVQFDGTACLAVPGASSTRYYARRVGESTIYKFVAGVPQLPSSSFTLPADGRDFRLRIEARGPASTNNALLGSNEMTVQITPGSDQLMNLRCLEMYVQVTTTPGALGPHEFGEVKVSAQLRDPAAATATPVVGASVEFSNITGGGILQEGGVTGATGEYYNVATLSAGSSGMTFVVNVVSNDGRRAVLNVSIPLREGASW